MFGTTTLGLIKWSGLHPSFTVPDPLALPPPAPLATTDEFVPCRHCGYQNLYTRPRCVRCTKRITEEATDAPDSHEHKTTTPVCVVGGGDEATAEESLGVCMWLLLVATARAHTPPTHPFRCVVPFQVVATTNPKTHQMKQWWRMATHNLCEMVRRKISRALHPFPPPSQMATNPKLHQMKRRWQTTKQKKNQMTTHPRPLRARGPLRRDIPLGCIGFKAQAPGIAQRGARWVTTGVYDSVGPM